MSLELESLNGMIQATDSHDETKLETDPVRAELEQLRKERDLLENHTKILEEALMNMSKESQVSWSCQASVLFNVPPPKMPLHAEHLVEKAGNLETAAASCIMA